MKNKGIFAPSDAEKRQLEEIAHLYFSTPRKGSGKATSPRQDEHPIQVPLGIQDSFFVFCTAGRYDAPLASAFLYNLGLVLKISEESVLLVCSNEAYRNRFSFAFRPDRERRVQVSRTTSSRGIVGPLGLYLLDAACLDDPHARATDGPEGSFVGQGSPFRFVLTDHPGPTSAPRAGASMMALFLVTPETPEDAFRGWREGAWSQGADAWPEHAGIVTAEVGGRDEAEGLYEQWKEGLRTLLPEVCRVECYGMCPGTEDKGSIRAGGEMGVLERPTGWMTRCFLETAALIRKAGRRTQDREPSEKEPGPTNH